MNKWQYYRLKNGMLIANLISNLIGFLITQMITGVWNPLPEAMRAQVDRLNLYFTPIAFMTGFVLTLAYERPLRRYLHAHFHPGKTLKEALPVPLRRRSLNEPFFLILMDFGLWIASSFYFSIGAWSMGAQPHVVQFMFAVGLYTGLVTSIIAFFTLEYAGHKWVTPVFFPDGRISTTPGVLRIRIGVRLTAMLMGCNIIPFIAILGTLRQMKVSAIASSTTVTQCGMAIAVNSLVFIAIGSWITLLVKGNLTRQLNHVIGVLKQVRQGNFDSKVPVTSNDEIGYAGEVINQMTEGLKERDMIKETFGRYVAHEVRDEILSGRIPLDGEVKEVVRIINRYFRSMEEAIQAHKGLVLQFLGDEIEAVFGAPVSRHDHACLAVAAAREMSRRIHQVNAELRTAGYPLLRHGIGIHSGEALAANIGSPNRLSYALVGDTVNIASRLQELNKVHRTEIILSGATRDRLTGDLPLTPLPETSLKGIARPISLYTL
ncbi:adenylate/guanylate cyclase domain-containing protein [Desulfatitalea tepidiphila]|uniref:adenylate/guanylate cyclase domain-containing protein n=1 Tax=Desulfatitalea tepidiphila TaxID=1185843 RepID=UPI00137937F5|nr:adenylate/guanylate cyclase domain-containing protein [Desulfatitalea tepidiphila]